MLRAPILAAALSLSALAAWPAAAQQATTALDLRVLANGTGAPLAGAEVRIPELKLRGVADEAGRVRIGSVPVGEHGLEIRRRGYQTERMVLGFAAGRVVEGEVELLPEPVLLEGVEVTGRSREGMERRSSGTRRDVVTREEIQGMLGRKQHVGQVIQGRIPGVQVWEGRISDESGLGGGEAPRVCIQMNRAQQQIAKRRTCSMVALYVNDVKVSDPGLFLLSFPLEEIESIELLGPIVAGARYGSDSGYGVLEIYTRGNAAPGRSRQR